MKFIKFLLIIFITINLTIKAESNQNLITELKKGGKLIFHLPIFHIVDKSNYKRYLKSNFNSMSYSIN